MDASQYEDEIRAILQAPDVDLTTVSAKRVRKQLVQRNPELTADQVKEHKAEIDAIISNVYEQVTAAASGEGADGGSHSAGQNGKRKYEDDDESGVRASPSSSKKKARKVKNETLNDEEIARQLQNEINGRDRPSRAAAPKPAKPKRSRKTKSAEIVDSDGEEGSDGKPKRRGGGGFSKEYTLSEPLASLLEVEKMSRPQVVKQIWVHIKKYNLQNPSDKREILCDDKLKAVFGVDKINMFKMNKTLGEHLYEPTA